MARNLKKLICVLLAVMLVGTASAIVLAEINKSADKTSATPDKPIDEAIIEAPIDERIEAKDTPIEVKPASIMQVSPFPTDANACSLDNMSEPAQVILLMSYGMLTSETIYLPHWFEIPDDYIAGLPDMLEGMKFIPVTGDKMVAEAKTALSNSVVQSFPLSLCSEEGDEIIGVKFYRSKEDAVWVPYVRIYEPIANTTTTEEEFLELANELIGQSWETGLYKIDPETMDAQLLETVTTMALGGSLDAYIDFADGLGTSLLNNDSKTNGTEFNTKYGYYSYFMEKFPYANIWG